MNAQKTIIWYQLHDESPAERAIRLSKELHRIFFESRDVCPAESVWEHSGERFICEMCGADVSHRGPHNTPPFLESLDAMQLIAESGKFAEVREEFFHWLSKERYECTIFLYGQIGSGVMFRGKGDSSQEAFYCAALASQGYTVIKEEGNEHNKIR